MNLTLSDAELFLLGWAVAMTILYFRERNTRENNHKILMHIIQDKKTRDQVVAQWEAFKEAKGMK